MFEDAYNTGYRAGLEKVSFISIDLKKILESDNKKHRVSWNFPNILNYSYAPGKLEKGWIPTIGMGLGGPNIGLRQG